MANRVDEVNGILGQHPFELPDEHGSVPAGTGIPSGGVQSSAGTNPRIDPSGNEPGRNANGGSPRIVEADSAIASTNVIDNGATRTRARRSNTGNGNARAATRTRAASPQKTENLEKLLFSIHLMLAAKTEIPELMLSQPAAHELAEAIQNVNALYGKTILGDTSFAWLNLIIALGGTYTPMIMAVRKRVKETAALSGEQPSTP
jgi:hypothetical protein